MTAAAVPVNVKGKLAVMVAEGSNVRLPLIESLIVPLTVSVPVDETEMGLSSVKVFVQVTVPLTVKVPVPASQDGAVPRGQVVPAATVKLTLVLAKSIILRVKLGAVNVAAVPPVNVIVPPLAAKVGVLVCVKLPAEIVQRPLVAVRLVPEYVTDPVVVIAPEPPLNTPPESVSPRVVNVWVVFVQVPSATTKTPTLMLIF